MNPSVRYYKVIAFLHLPKCRTICRAAIVGSVQPLSAGSYAQDKALERFVLKYNRQGFEFDYRWNEENLQTRRQQAEQLASQWFEKKLARMPKAVEPDVVSIGIYLTDAHVGTAPI